MNKALQAKLLARVLRGEDLNFRGVTRPVVISALRTSVALAWDLIVQGQMCPAEMQGFAVEYATREEKEHLAGLLEANRIPTAREYAHALYQKYELVLWPLEEAIDVTDQLRTIHPLANSVMNTLFGEA